MQLAARDTDQYDIQDDNDRKECHRVVVKRFQPKEGKLFEMSDKRPAKERNGLESNTHNQTDDADDNDSDII